MAKRHYGVYIGQFAAVLLLIGSFWWMAYSIRDHYHYQHVCRCVVKWEYLPFGASFFALLFALAMLSQKATKGAAAVILPFATLVVEKLGRRGGDPTAVVVHPAPGTSATAEQVAAEIADQLKGKASEKMPGEGT
jgi:hypothetical protein